MEVKPGYKQTEVGVIPEEWEVTPLGELGKWKGGMTPSMRNPDYWLNGTVPWISSGDVKSMHLKETGYCITSEAVTQGTTTMLPAGAVVLVTRSGILRKYLPVATNVVPMAINQDIKALIPEEEISSSFILHALTERGPRILSRCMKAGTTVESVEFKWLKAFAISVPPLPEQRAIATALSDVDGLLGGLDRLIAKKRDLKQAAMQQLLSGQIRLPGFHGEWQETTLGEMGECIIGLTYKPENVVEHGLLVLRSSNVQNGCLAYDDNVHVNLQVAEHLYTQLGDILVCVRNGSRALIGKCAVIDSAAVGMTFGAFMSVYRTKHWRYVLHAFQADDIQRQIRDNIGATINQITNKDMNAFRLRLPPEDEQTAIAEVLTDMDAELVALEQRREKTRALKQAMMQELLTGRTRLVLPQARDTTPPKPAHNWQINEAVVISVLAKYFGSEQFPLGRKRYTKFSYLLHRHIEKQAQGYLKKAAGPYNPAVKYKGPEGIALKNNYVRRHTQDKFSGFVSSDKIAEAEDYFARWYGKDVITWLEQFRRKTNDDLELLSTVDMAMEDLRAQSRTVDLKAVKEVIDSNPEWEAKLSRPIFSDANIKRTIGLCIKLFGS